MSVSSTSDLQKLDAVLYDRPAGRNIIGHAIETITNLRADLAAARAEAKINEDALQSACVKALNERDALRADLAAARALLQEASDDWVPHASSLSAKIADFIRGEK